MKLRMEVSGGLGVRIHGALDTDTLPPELSERVEQALRPDATPALSEPSAFPDARLFRISLLDHDPPVELEIDESTSSEELSEVANELYRALVHTLRNRK